MAEFCEDPEKYIEGMITVARRCPSLIHLLGLQPQIPNTDISELFAMATMLDELSLSSSSTKVNSSSQTPFYINTSIPDPQYHWNEWDLRRKAIQMADLCNKRTHSTQTDESHFRRDTTTQYTLQPLNVDGTMPGVGTQTGVSKGTNVSRTTRYLSGLRGRPTNSNNPNSFKMVSFTMPELVEEGSNASLKLKQSIRDMVNSVNF